MTEPLRTDPSHAGPLSEADREARIEQLLLSGLDHYFAGKYEQAINIWTRVAFLERGHGRARAYIERARGAIAERQRESDELLHTGVAAYHAGDLESARSLLTRAVNEGGAHETALVFLQRLGRLEAASDRLPEDPPAGEPVPHTQRPAAAAEGTSWVTTILASAALATAILVSALPVASWLAELPVDAPVVRPAPNEPLPIVRASDVRMSQARDLVAAGRPHEALRLLDTIDLADPLRSDADRLKAAVQRDLIAAAIRRAAPAAAETEPDR